VHHGRVGTTTCVERSVLAGFGLAQGVQGEGAAGAHLRGYPDRFHDLLGAGSTAVAERGVAVDGLGRGTLMRPVPTMGTLSLYRERVLF
jgi:hypothetical protein